VRDVEKLTSELTSAALECQRALRDAFAEATFFEIYGNLAAFYLPEQQRAEAKAVVGDPRQLSFVKEALDSIAKGGYPEALARVAVLLAHKDEPLPLSRLQLAHDLLEEYRDYLPDLPRDEARRIGGEQEIIARYEPDQAVATLPSLLRAAHDRKRLVDLLERVLSDKRVQTIQPSAAQKSMLARIRSVLAPANGGPRSPRRGNGSADPAATHKAAARIAKRRPALRDRRTTS